MVSKLAENQTNLGNDPYSKVTIFGLGWTQKEDSSFVWTENKITKKFDRVFGEWQISSEQTTEYTPEAKGLAKSKSSVFFFKRETVNPDSFDSMDVTWWKMPVTWTVNKSQGTIWLRESQGKIYILELFNGQCIEAPYANTENVTVKRGKISKVASLAELRRLSKLSAYRFGKVTGSGASLDFITCV